MKSITTYINEKLLISKRFMKYDPENELDIPAAHLEYIRALIVLAQGKAVTKEQLKGVYEKLSPEYDKIFTDFYDNLIKYINNHPELNANLEDNDFDKIYDILKLLPENELENYVEKKK